MCLLGVSISRTSLGRGVEWSKPKRGKNRNDIVFSLLNLCKPKLIGERDASFGKVSLQSVDAWSLLQVSGVSVCRCVCCQVGRWRLLAMLSSILLLPCVSLSPESFSVNAYCVDWLGAKGAIALRLPHIPRSLFQCGELPERFSSLGNGKRWISMKSVSALVLTFAPSTGHILPGAFAPHARQFVPLCALLAPHSGKIIPSIGFIWESPFSWKHSDASN